MYGCEYKKGLQNLVYEYMDDCGGLQSLMCEYGCDTITNGLQSRVNDLCMIMNTLH